MTTVVAAVKKEDGNQVLPSSYAYPKNLIDQ